MEVGMAYFLLQVAYTPQAWATMMKNPQDRVQALAPVLDRMGGKMECAYFAFGDYDVVAIMQMPANTDAAAFSLAASAGGAVKSIKTTPLLTTAEGLDAMRKAAASGYTPPNA
jgi:uncharacterized protein with GYD domain